MENLKIDKEAIKYKCKASEARTRALVSDLVDKHNKLVDLLQQSTLVKND